MILRRTNLCSLFDEMLEYRVFENACDARVLCGTTTVIAENSGRQISLVNFGLWVLPSYFIADVIVFQFNDMRSVRLFELFCWSFCLPPHVTCNDNKYNMIWSSLEHTI